MSLTLLQPTGYGASTCGYCAPAGQRSAKRGSRSYGFIAHQMGPQTYQDLIDRGWRRSGGYTYHPDMQRTCCPQYTIRLKVGEFKPSRQQRSTLNKWNRYVSGEEPKTGKGKARPFELGPELRRCRSDLSDSSEGMAHKFTMELTPADATDETFDLYRRYQIAVHKDPPRKARRSGFSAFLCESPLGDTPIEYARGADTTGLPSSYGSYHLLYRVDGKLVGISVIDILPTCVSSVYFIWDPEWAWAGLGKLSALYEIGLTLDMAAAGAPGMEWLYMGALEWGEKKLTPGYWIATCQKMRYKGEYAPSFLLDPGTQVFHPLTPKLDQFLQVHPGYTPFADIEAMDAAEVKEEWEAKRKDAEDVVMAEPREPLPPGGKGKAVANGDGSSDDDDEDDDDDDAAYPTPPPPGFGVPASVPAKTLNALFVFYNDGDDAAIYPFAAFKSSLTPAGRQMSRELVAAVGPDMFWRGQKDAKDKVLLYFG